LNTSVQNLTAGVSSLIAGYLVTIPEGTHHVEGFWRVGALAAVFTLIAIWMMKSVKKHTIVMQDSIVINDEPDGKSTVEKA